LLAEDFFLLFRTFTRDNTRDQPPYRWHVEMVMLDSDPLLLLYPWEDLEYQAAFLWLFWPSLPSF
jgi:hypothetical protein